MKKLVKTGSIIELYEYKGYLNGKGGYHETKDLEQQEENYKNQVRIRRDMVRRLACANFNCDNAKFLTLTFADNKTNVQECRLLFKNFIKRLKYHLKLKSIQYLAVVEFQKRGAIHYHVLLNIPYTEQEVLTKIWGHGFVWIKKISHVDNVGAYIIKYMTKDNADVRLMGENGYLHSKNLKKPLEITDVKDIDLFNTYMQLIEKAIKNVAPEYKATYDSVLGLCNYKQYNLNRQN